jgi:hypothetical protein
VPDAKQRAAAWIGCALAALLVLIVGLRIRDRLRDPAIQLLVREGGASWIRYPEPFSHVGRPAGREIVFFRAKFAVEHPPAEARLVVRGFREVVVQLDRTEIPAPARRADEWKEPLALDLAPLVRAGAHQLAIAVRNENSHAAVLAYCPVLGLATGTGWDASLDGMSWKPAVRVEDTEALPIWARLPSAAAALGQEIGWILPLFLVVGVWTIARARGRLAPFAFSPSRVRWLMIAAWVVLAANNFLKIPLAQGFDVDAHMDYVRYVAERGRLPLANEGWEMSQPPLYYILSAALQRFLALGGRVPAEACLRLLPLACGALQVEVAYRIARRVFPDRADVQCIAIWVAGLLPVHLYISQVVGNEPLAALTVAFVALLCVRILCRPEQSRGFRDAAWIGLALGLALLTKVTAVLWVPLTAVAWLGRAVVRKESLRAASLRLAVTWGVALVVSGAYYARNWLELGKPFVVGWDWKEVNRIWWQDPGYRIPEHFTRFGRSLVQPVYASVHGFWDGLYSTLWTDGLLSGTMVPPSWNIDCMLTGVLFGIPLTAAMLVGACWAPSDSPGARNALRFAACAVLLYLLAAMDLYLRLPTYSGVKASHTLGLLPFYALLAAAGLRPLLANVWCRAAVAGGLVCFGVASYAAYFVR